MYSILLVIAALYSHSAPVDSVGGGKWKIGGFLDTYYGSSLYSTEKISRPFFVSSAKNNQAEINLAFAEIRYQSDVFRINVAPAIGSFMRANYAGEKENNKYIFEANAAIRLNKKFNVWLEGGVLDSPYSSEGPVSRDQLLYSRSFASEYVPYYLSGMRLTIKPSDRWNFKLMRLTGWQQITDRNIKKSLGTNLTIKTGNKSELTYNTYAGNEFSVENFDYRMRIFHDLYLKVTDHQKWDAAIGAYAGNQKRENGDNLLWWQVNIMGKRVLNETISISGRIEYFSDPNKVMIRVPESEFKMFSTGACLDINVGKKALLRIDGRYFRASKDVYEQRNGKSNRDLVVMTSLTTWF